MANLIKFVATTTQVQDAVIWVDDVEMAIKNEGYAGAIEDIMDRVFTKDLKGVGTIHVVDDNRKLASEIAEVLNAKYEKEMELMKESNMAKDIVNEVVDAPAKKEEEKEMTQAEKIVQSAAAQKFLQKHGAKAQNAKKPESKKEETTTNTKEEKKMNTKTMGGRRRVAGANVGQESTETKQEQTNNQKEMGNVNNKGMGSKGNGRRRMAGNTQVAGEKKERTTGRKRLGRTDSARPTFTKHEGPWYLNVSLYPVLERFESIIETMSDDELGLTDIRLVEPTEISRYERKDDVDVVVQLLHNGSILEFPIKEAAGNSKSDLSSPAIGWVTTRNGMRPAFGNWVSNTPMVQMKCSCGNQLEVRGDNVWCGQCKTRHDDVAISAEHNFDFNFPAVFFNENPHHIVPRDILALVMAIAQYDAGLKMGNVIAE